MPVVRRGAMLLVLIGGLSAAPAANIGIASVRASATGSLEARIRALEVDAQLSRLPFPCGQANTRGTAES
jgi:hypothetical protein